MMEKVLHTHTRNYVSKRAHWLNIPNVVYNRESVHQIRPFKTQKFQDLMDRIGAGPCLIEYTRLPYMTVVHVG